LLDEKREDYWFYEFDPIFTCAADIPRQIRGGDTSFSFVTTANGGCCSPSVLKEAYRVANDITEEAYLEYLMEEIPTSKLLFGGFAMKFRTCLPSGRLACIGFMALLYLMFSLF